MPSVHYVFKVKKAFTGEVTASYIGLSDVINNNLVAICDDNSCSFRLFPRTSYLNWSINLVDLMGLDLLHHELIKSNKHHVTLGDPDIDFWQSGDLDDYPESLGNNDFFEEICEQIETELKNYLVNIRDNVEHQIRVIVSWNKSNGYISVKIKEENSYEND